jgi:hypothetical protein
MSYQNDIFISYRREKYAWTPWARDIFKIALESSLQRELGDPPNIFIDEQTPVGTDSINHLAMKLARSKVMVALLSKDYFSSDWCVHELDLMMERAHGDELIIPIVVHDGLTIPEEVCRLQYADFRKYANPVLYHTTSLYAEFWEKLRELAERIGIAIQAAPDFNPKWESTFTRRFTRVHAAVVAHRRVPPKHFKLKESPPPRLPPRMSV